MVTDASPLDGRFFVFSERPIWQGHVLCRVEPGYYLCQLHEWFLGMPSNQVVIPLERLTQAQLFEDADDWRAAGDRILTQAGS